MEKKRRKALVEEDRPPVCPACGVTMGMVVTADGSTRFVCLECGFPDDRGDA
jgi:transposase